jgi:hypothetical protein
MPPRRNAHKTYTEGSLQLAISAIEQGEIENERRVAVAYDVPRSIPIVRIPQNV